MKTIGRVHAMLGLGLVVTVTVPRCACDEEPGLRRAEHEMRLTFLEEDSCSANVIQRRIPDDYRGGLVPSTDFGSRGERRFEVRAIGEAALTVVDVRLSEEDPEFSLELSDADGDPVALPLSLPPSSRAVVPPGLVITARYAAADSEPDLVELIILSDDPDRQEVRFALAAGRGRLEVCVDDICGPEAAVDFGLVSRGSSAVKTVLVRNDGEGELDLRSIHLRSASGEFCAPQVTELQSGQVDCALIPQCLVLRPNETYAVDITYAPVDGEQDTGELVIVSGDAATGNVSVPIVGRGAGPAVCVCTVAGGDCEPTGLIDFGLADVGAISERLVRLVSCGTEPVDLTEARLEAEAGHPFTTGPEFSIAAPIPTGRLEPGDFAEGRIRYAPTSPGRHRGGLRYAFGQSNLQNWVGLVGQAATCDLEVFPPRLDFGTVAGGASTEREVSLVNNGAKRCTITAIGDPGSPFTIVDRPSLPLGIDRGQSHTLTVRFSPPAGPEASFTSGFDVTSDELSVGATHRVELVAAGGGAPVCEVLISPSGGGLFPMRDGLLNFGAVNVGYSTSLPIRIRNIGNVDCTLSRYRLNSILGGSEFSVTTLTPPPFAIPPGQQTEIAVEFSPNSARDLAYTPLLDAVDFSLAGPGLAQTDWSLGILARATIPEIDVLPRDVDFGVVTWERPVAPDNRSACGSQTRTVSVYNSGSGPLTISGVSIDPSSDPVFLIQQVRQGGSALRPPYRGIRVGGGSHIEIDLRFFPTRANPAEHRGLLVIDNDVTNPMGGGAPLTVPLAGEGTTNSVQTDTFTQLADNKVDILWVVDDSGSMQDEQNSLSQNFRSFIGFADGLGVDYQVGVITTEVRDATVAGILWACRGFNPVIRSRDTNRVQAFECAARVTSPPNGNRRPNPGGSDSQEAGLQAARIALDVPNVGGANSGFLRPDARLAVIVVSDEDDQSNGPVSLYVDFFRNLKGFRNPQLVSFSAIAGDVPNGCSTAAAGTRYDGAVSALRGQFESICSTSWNRLLQNIGLGVFALRSSWTLSRAATASSIRVTVNGQAVSQSGTSGWSFDASANSVSFHGAAVPPVGATIQVAYGALCLP